MFSEHLPVKMRKDLAQKISSGSCKYCVDCRMQEESGQFLCSLGGSASPGIVDTDVFCLPGLPALLLQDLQTLVETVDLMADAGAWGTDADCAVLTKKPRIDHDKVLPWKKFFLYCHGFRLLHLHHIAGVLRLSICI